MCTPSGRGTWALQEQIWGQLGTNWFFPHSETLFLGGQLGTKLTHLEPSWCQLGSTWTPSCSSKPTWANLERTWTNLDTQTSIKSKKKVQIANGPIKQMLALIFWRFWVFQNEQFWITNRGNLAFWRPWEAILDILRPTWANMEPSWVQLGPILNQLGANLAQLGLKFFQVGQHEPTWSELEPT